MSEFTLRKIIGVSGFYKLVINDKCSYDEFKENLQKSETKSLSKIFRHMDKKRNNTRLKDFQFKYLQPKDNITPDFEFKGDALRLYGIELNKTDVIVIGGYKKKQAKDIKRLRRIKAEFIEFLKTNSLEQIIEKKIEKI